MSDILYKITGPSGTCCNGGKGYWKLPNKAGDNWMPRITSKIIPCERGYHICKAKHLLYWLNDEIWGDKP